MLEFLLGRRNPTRTWQAGLSQPLAFDLDAATLHGVRLGEPLDRLSLLGPDENLGTHRSGELVYFSAGLTVSFSLSTRCITAYRIVLRDPSEPRFRPFSGPVFAGAGCRLDLHALDQKGFVDSLGPYYWRDSDEDESILFYEFTGLEWQVEFGPHLRFNSLIVTSEPLLADEQQRRAYRVTRPWPPVVQAGGRQSGR